MKVVVEFVIQAIGGAEGDRWRCRRLFYVVPLKAPFTCLKMFTWRYYTSTALSMFIKMKLTTLAIINIRISADFLHCKASVSTKCFQA